MKIKKKERNQKNNFIIRLSIFAICFLINSCNIYSYYSQAKETSVSSANDGNNKADDYSQIRYKISQTKVIFEPNNNYALIFKNELLDLMGCRDNNDEIDYKFVLLVDFSYQAMFMYIGNTSVSANYKLYDLQGNYIENIVTDKDFEEFYHKSIAKGVAFATKKVADDGGNDGSVAGTLSMDNYKSSLEKKYTAKYNFFNEEISENKNIIAISGNYVSKSLMYNSTVNIPQAAYETEIANLNTMSEELAKQIFESLIVDLNNNTKANGLKMKNKLADPVDKSKYPKDELKMFNKKNTK